MELGTESRQAEVLGRKRAEGGAFLVKRRRFTMGSDSVVAAKSCTEKSAQGVALVRISLLPDKMRLHSEIK